MKSIPLRSDRFGFEPEITIKLAKRHARVYEVPISYEGRTYEEGKKIGLADAVQTVWTIFRFGLTSDLYTDPGAEILDAFSVAPRFNQWMADTIRPFLGRRVLEIGAGMGNLTRPLSLGRDRYVASDVDSRHLARLKSTLQHRSNVEIHSGDASRSEDFEKFRGSMENVVCLNVMEHVDDDLACARNMYGVLAGGGRAIVLVPHGPRAFGSLDRCLGIGGATRARVCEMCWSAADLLWKDHRIQPHFLAGLAFSRNCCGARGSAACRCVCSMLLCFFGGGSTDFFRFLQFP